jgi:DNA (cytosine-5)-methyltransferase 1
MESEIRVLDLFSGIGGFSLGLERAGPFRTVAFCEREPFPQAVLRKHWPEVPIYDDVRTIPTERLGRIDLICGGFPCQPWSVAGQQRGAEDDRDLWPVMASLIEKLRPRWVVGENVRGFVNEPLGLQRSLSDLESLGYQTAPFVIPACAVDAPHRRDRVWIVAHADSKRERDGSGKVQGTDEKIQQRDHDAEFGNTSQPEAVAHAAQLQRDGGGEHSEPRERQVSQSGKRGGADDVADADSASSQGGCIPSRIHAEYADADSGSDGIGRQTSLQWLPEPGVGRVAHGVSRRVDRLKALGNAVVPQVVEQIGRAIMAS